MAAAATAAPAFAVASVADQFGRGKVKPGRAAEQELAIEQVASLPSLSPSLSHTHTLSHSFSHSLTLSLYLSLSLSLSFSPSLSHTRACRPSPNPLRRLAASALPTAAWPMHAGVQYAHLLYIDVCLALGWSCRLRES